MSHKNPSFTLIIIFILFTAICCRKDDVKPPAQVKDIEGNIYLTALIGNTIWMTENLKTSKYNDGTSIPLITDDLAWHDLTTPGFCWYNNDATLNKNVYGALYNGFSISTGKLCPSGWHVPSRQEWQELRDLSGDTLLAGGKLKKTGTEYWRTPNKGADNGTGFNALGAGFRYFEGSFSSLLSYTGFWSSTVTGSLDQWFAGLYYGDASFTIDHRSKTYGFSVRCVKGP